MSDVSVEYNLWESNREEAATNEQIFTAGYTAGYTAGVESTQKWETDMTDIPPAVPLLAKDKDGEYYVVQFNFHKYRGYGFYLGPDTDIECFVGDHIVAWRKIETNG